MLQFLTGPHGRNCQSMNRRTALKAGFLGFVGLSTADMARLRAEGLAKKTGKSVILIWLDGGPSHIDTYDPKPEAPSEYRGPFGAIETKVSGLRLSSLLPEHAKHADKMAFLRSMRHDNGDHFAAAHWMLTGRLGSTAVDLPQKYPSVGSYVARLNDGHNPGLPAYVGLPASESIYLFPGYMGAAYLGPSCKPFDAHTQQKYLGSTAQSKDVQPAECLSQLGGDGQRLGQRLGLLNQVDQLRRDIDRSGLMDSMDRYTQEAASMVLNGKAREAFDVAKESDATRDRYGRTAWGHYTLMARRLVEAGVGFVTVDMPHWDHHSSLEKGLGTCVPVLDKAVGGLMQDLADRNMLDDVLVMVMGEFGRTPRINQGLPQDPVPGRDHWGNAFSVMLAGGGLRMGQAVGATNSKGEEPSERPLTPADLLATVYHVLGIDPGQTFNDFSGRPVPILDQGRVISELV